MGHVIRDRVVGCRWVVSYELAQCQVELRERSERLSIESVRSLELPRCAESLGTLILRIAAYAATVTTACNS